jgi:hypothetical protein
VKSRCYANGLLRLRIRHCKTRAVRVIAANDPHNKPPPISTRNCTSRRSSGVLVMSPTKVPRPTRSRTIASAVSAQVSRGDTIDLRAPCKASIPRPAHHQKKIPANGQASALHSSVSIPLGVHSILSGLAMTYGNSARITGKLSNTGTRIRTKARPSALSAACCCSFVIGGIAICVTGSDSLAGLAEAYDSILRDSSKIKKPPMGHRASKQSQSWKIGKAHRSGKQRGLVGTLDRSENRPTTKAIAIERIAAKRSKYQTINPENHDTGQCRRVKSAHISAAGLSNEKERTRVTIPVVTARHNLAVVGFILALSHYAPT